MKKMFLGFIAVSIIILAATYSTYAIQNKEVKLADWALTHVEGLAQGEDGNYSCTVTVECGFPLTGSISCSGQNCSRGLDWSNGACVECDGNKTYC